MHRIIAVGLLMLLAAAGAAAESPEAEYRAARDRAVALLQQKYPGEIDQAAMAEEGALREALAARLVGLIGAAAPPDFVGPGTMRPDSLFAGDMGSDALDGMRFPTPDQAGSVLVTHRDLLQHWLEGDGPAGVRLPADPAAAFDSGLFYTKASGSDARVDLVRALPIRPPAGAVVAAAWVAATAQDYRSDPPDTIAVALIAGARVFVAIVPAITRLAPIAACDAVLAQFRARHAEDAGQAAFDECWRERIADLPGFAAWTAQGQALVDAFAGR